jgi:hypothetical protein
LPVLHWRRALLVFSGCTDRELRGTVVPSGDGRTWLVVDADNGARCGSIRLDGQIWPHRIHEAGPIQPGVHEIACGDGAPLEFEVPPRATFHFDYRGP